MLPYGAILDVQYQIYCTPEPYGSVRYRYHTVRSYKSTTILPHNNLLRCASKKQSPFFLIKWLLVFKFATPLLTMKRRCMGSAFFSASARYRQILLWRLKHVFKVFEDSRLPQRLATTRILWWSIGTFLFHIRRQIRTKLASYWKPDVTYLTPILHMSYSTCVSTSKNRFHSSVPQIHRYLSKQCIQHTEGLAKSSKGRERQNVFWILLRRRSFSYGRETRMVFLYIQNASLWVKRRSSNGWS